MFTIEPICIMSNGVPRDRRARLVGLSSCCFACFVRAGV